MSHSRALLVNARGELVTAASVADTARTRIVGLLGRRELAPGDAMVLDPCNAIHTWFMRFSIDVVFLDRRGTILKISERVRPFRFVWGGWQARRAVELPAGSRNRLRLREGDRLHARRVRRESADSGEAGSI